MRRAARQLGWVVGMVCGGLGLGATGQEPDEPSAEQARFFESRVRPLLVEHCQACHGEKQQKSGLRVDSRAALMAGGDQGPAVVPGQLDESLLVAAVRYDDDSLKMPPNRKLAREQVEDLSRWVQMGAPWPGADEAPAAIPAVRAGLEVTEKDRQHWAFRPVVRPAIPSVRDPGWVRNPIDAFVLAGLDAAGLKPNGPAERHELIRRVTFDLIGLPPTPEEVRAFVADTAPDAYERLVERLLASPQYGEKWGRHWLDLVRFAETNSYERDNPKPNTWRYRDYVIRALNEDRPYDRFVREQLAGDELPDGGNDGLVATGYYRLGIWDDEPTDVELARYDGLDDVVATTGQVFLGLTIDCARCHDHKIDPIPQRDYYRLLGFFQNINHFRNGGPTDEAPVFEAPGDQAAYEAAEQERRRQRASLEAEVRAIGEEFLQKFRAEPGNAGIDPEIRELRRLLMSDGKRVLSEPRYAHYLEVRERLAELRKPPVPASMALCVTEAGGTVERATHVLMRGNPHAEGDEVEPGFPEVLGSRDSVVIPTPAPGARTSGRRTVLADWIASPSNPLTARVAANRVWQHHFGRGIVRSSSNFGVQGDRPTHPELLDWLASELVAEGWRFKELHRTIVTSNAYRMSSRPNVEALAKDPANDHFWRFDMRRLSAEELRDSILCLSGSLNPAQGGPSIFPEIPKEVMAGQSQPGKDWETSTPREQDRRSVYVFVKRSLLLPILEVFDLAETDRSSPVRFSTTQPTQALLLLNSTFLGKQAKVLGERLEREAGSDAVAQVRRALELATGRVPTDGEVRRGVALIEGLQRDQGMSEEAAREAFALVVLNLNEFVYVD